ncbi:MAG: peptidoglycan DD-metalloendopeptidase family protein [Bacilli bacterium]|nr:peptidoglycan DD-metalloendopeptidase family protein [Bacilli bacterium]
MKKFIFGLLVLTIFFTLVVPTYAAEKTLGQLKQEAEANRAAYNKAKEEKSLSEEERDKVIAQKEQVQTDIEKVQTEVKSIEEQVQKLQEDIEKKDKQMKEIMGFVQVSNGEANYMEYIFGATDFTDFIYRVSVAEQLGDYNDKLIKEYEKDVKKLDEKQKELTNKQQELEKKSQELSVLEAKLNKEIEEASHGMLSKDEEYNTTISLINNLKKMGCSDNQTQSQCQAEIDRRNRAAAQSYGGGGGGGGAATPVSTSGTYMPIAYGYVTSDYGWRGGEFHTGIDFSGTGYGSNVYSVASGTVVNITYPAYRGACGNHIVYVYHNINGVQYTTSYWHLINVSVSIGQYVTPNTVIGHMGGLHSEDSCAYGAHVHLNLFRGLSTNNSGRINPRIMMPQIPGEWQYFRR